LEDDSHGDRVRPHCYRPVRVVRFDSTETNPRCASERRRESGAHFAGRRRREGTAVLVLDVVVVHVPKLQRLLQESGLADWQLRLRR